MFFSSRQHKNLHHRPEKLLLKICHSAQWHWLRFATVHNHTFTYCRHVSGFQHICYIPALFFHKSWDAEACCYTWSRICAKDLCWHTVVIRFLPALMYFSVLLFCCLFLLASPVSHLYALRGFLLLDLSFLRTISWRVWSIKYIYNFYFGFATRLQHVSQKYRYLCF